MVAKGIIVCLIYVYRLIFWSLLIEMVRTFGFGGDISFSLLKRKFDDCRFFCSETKKENNLPHELQKGLTIECLTPRLLALPISTRTLSW